jgi:Tol biopolymer transport system component
MATASLVLGIVSLIFFVFILPEVLAVIFGVLALREIHLRRARTGKARAVVGIVLGVLTGCVAVLLIIALATPYNTPAVPPLPRHAGSPAGLKGRIVFISDRGRPHGAATGPCFFCDVYVMRADGRGVRRLTSDRWGDTDPVWSPDGTKIAYSASTGKQSPSGSGCDAANIWVINTNGTGRRELTHDSASNWLPAWSPDGTHLAYASDTTGSFQVYTMRADGTNNTQLTTTGGTDPSWSPNGRLIAYVAGPAPGYLYTMHPDGTHKHRLTATKGAPFYPRWSPNGASIIFTHDTGHITPGIYLIHTNGTDLHYVNTHVGDATDASFSPNGQRIIFCSIAGGNYNLYTTTPTGKNLIQITTTHSLDAAPYWAPTHPTS